MQPLPLAVRRLWRLSAVGLAGAVLLAAGLLDVGIRTGLDVAVPPLLVPLAVTAVVAVGAWWYAEARYRGWRFELTEDWVRAEWGVWTRRTATVPRNRVQTMTSANGPVDRLLGLTSVVVHTAGAGAPNLELPHLADDTVEWLRGELARGRRP